METSQYRVTNISEVSWGAMGKDTMGNTCNMGQLMRDCTTDRVIPTSGARYGKGEEPTGFQNAPTEDEKQIGMSDLKNQENKEWENDNMWEEEGEEDQEEGDPQGGHFIVDLAATSVNVRLEPTT